MKPKTPLPWEDTPDFPGPDSHSTYEWHSEDYDYVIHACNAYPKLVDFISLLAEDPFDNDCGWRIKQYAQEILKELGEL